MFDPVAVQQLKGAVFVSAGNLNLMARVRQQPNRIPEEMDVGGVCDVE